MLAQSHDAATIVDAVTDYIARRMIEREQAMVVTPMSAETPAAPVKRQGGRFGIFVLGFFAGLCALFGFALLMALR